MPLFLSSLPLRFAQGSVQSLPLSEAKGSEPFVSLKGKLREGSGVAKELSHNIQEVFAMPHRKRTFETRGPVDPERNYMVPRTAETADLVQRIKDGRYIVIFAPRQTGKTTFFRWALSAMVAEDDSYFPIQLDFETFRNASVERFYGGLQRRMCEDVLWEFNRRQLTIDGEFQHFLENYPLKDIDSF